MSSDFKKTDLVHTLFPYEILKKMWPSYRTYEEANLALFEFIESWYNNKRIHSNIGYLTPNEFDKLAA